jgi:pimeloyl-ACP methyl ester carboxylesterase
MPLSILLACLLFIHTVVIAQTTPINNLVHSKNYRTGAWGVLGEVKEFGSGKQEVILLPGWGFDWTIFSDFIKRHETDYHMWAITLPGFGNTPAPPMPEQTENFRELYWTKGAVKALSDLIDSKNITAPIIISCFSYSNIVAMLLALDHPQKVGKLVVISGIAKFTGNYPSLEPRNLESRCNYIEKYIAPQWFKTVSTETWNKGNFTPGTFSKDSLKGVQYWKTMSSVPIPVMVRYLCEFYCTDLSLEYSKLAIPVLILVPSFTPAFLSKPEHSYLAPFFHFSWMGALPASNKIQMVTISDTHGFIMHDQPEKLDAVLKEFLNGESKPLSPMR